MNNSNVFVILAGMVILNIIAFLVANSLLYVPAWLNYTMIGVEAICFLTIIYGRMKDFKHIDGSLGIILNIFLLLLLVASIILFKSSQ